MKKIFYSLMVCSCLHSSSFAQSTKEQKPTYKSAIGLRVSPFGVSFKTNSERGKTTFEIIGYFKDGFTASGLYYWNIKINEPGNIKAYIGGGAQAGFKNDNAGGGAVLGLSGIVGADYKFMHLPINISLDWQPSLQFGKNNDFKGWGGIAARFTL